MYSDFKRYHCCTVVTYLIPLPPATQNLVHLKESTIYKSLPSVVMPADWKGNFESVAVKVLVSEDLFEIWYHG